VVTDPDVVVEERPVDLIALALGARPVVRAAACHLLDAPTVDSPWRAGALNRPPLTRKRFRVANIKSQIKRIRTNEKARLRNKAVKSELKTVVRRVREAVSSGDAEAAVAAQRLAGKKLDKAVSKGVIHKNQAANRKSALTKLANTVSA
jgi:small subunit ribosomal protein S20